MSVLSTLAHIAPPPTYINLPSVGVDVSDTSIKYIQFKKARHGEQGMRLAAWGDVAVPEGAFDHGQVQDQKKFTDALRTLATQLSVPFVRVSLPEERAYIFETEVQKGVSSKEIRNMLEFRLEENVPLSPRDAYFDYTLLEDATRPDIYRVIVTVYNREIVTSYYEACLAASLVPVAFEVEAQAIARATIPAEQPGTHMIVDFGKTRSGIGIVHRGTLMYTSTIDIGGSELSRNLRRAVGDLAESELTKIKNTQGIIRGAADSEVRDALISMLSIVKDEISARIEYWNNKEQFGEERLIDSIILCGGSINLKGMPEYFTETLNIPVVRANVWQNSFSLDSYIPPIGRRFSYGYATAVGLALAGYNATL